MDLITNYGKKRPCNCEEERRSNLVAMQIGHVLATGLPRYARNDTWFYLSFLANFDLRSFLTRVLNVVWRL